MSEYWYSILELSPAMVSPRKRPRPVQEKEQKVVGVDPRLPPVTDSKSCKTSKFTIQLYFPMRRAWIRIIFSYIPYLGSFSFHLGKMSSILPRCWLEKSNCGFYPTISWNQPSQIIYSEKFVFNFRAQRENTKSF